MALRPWPWNRGTIIFLIIGVILSVLLIQPEIGKTRDLDGDHIGWAVFSLLCASIQVARII